MEQIEVPYGGVYRLTIDGVLVGEFVPGPLWTEMYQHAEATYTNVAYSWVPFTKPAPQLKEPGTPGYNQSLREALSAHSVSELLSPAHLEFLLQDSDALALLKPALEESEKHVPKQIENSWISCSCGHEIREYYWTRHIQGANGSALAQSVLSRLNGAFE